MKNILSWEEVYTYLHRHREGYGRTKGDRCRASKTTDFIKKTLPVGATVLDLGCGRGGLIRNLLANGYKPLGVEFDPWLIANDLRRLHARLGDIANLSWAADGSFDAAVAQDSLEHLPSAEVAAHTIAEIARVARTMILVSVGISDPVHVIEGVAYHVHPVQQPPEWWYAEVGKYVQEVRKASWGTSIFAWGVKKS